MIPIRPIKIGKPTLDTGTDCWIGSIASIAWFPHTATSPLRATKRRKLKLYGCSIDLKACWIDEISMKIHEMTLE